MPADVTGIPRVGVELQEPIRQLRSQVGRDALLQYSARIGIQVFDRSMQ